MSRNHAYGCILGAAIGDAMGAPLEFTGPTADPKKIASAMRLEGGGPLRTAPGQYTDDFECALSLMRGLSTTVPNQSFPADAVALAYREWYDSNPIDMGNTCGTAFAGRPMDGIEAPGELMAATAKKFSFGSKANGALMRCMPIAVFGHELSDDAIGELARADCVLSHPNETCQHANAAYCIAAAHLIRTEGSDAGGAIARASAYCKKHADAEVQSWLDEALESHELPACAAENVGFAKWAFIYTFQHLQRKTPFMEAAESVLRMKGDSDTNTCIVLGMLGALHGVDAIPSDLQTKIVSSVPYGRRPPHLTNAAIPDAFDKLWQSALR